MTVFAAVSSDAAIVLVELGVAVLVMAGAARLAARFGLSPIPLYLLIGIAIGSGWLPVDPEPSFVETGSLIGVVLLLLTLGLEYSPVELVTNLRRGAPDGLVDLLANFLPGLAMGLILGWSPLASLLLGGVTWVSSSGVVAKTLADLGRLGFRETPTVLSIIVLEDLGMAVYLPIVAALIAGGAFVEGLLVVLLAVGVVVVVLVIAVRKADTVSRIVSTPSGEGFLLTVFGITLLVAGLQNSPRSQRRSARSSSGLQSPGRSRNAPAPRLTRCATSSPRSSSCFSASRSISHQSEGHWVEPLFWQW